MTPEEKQILIQAREFLKEKRYDEARRLLKRIPDNPKAAEWLAKLNTLPAQQSAPPPTNPQAKPDAANSLPELPFISASSLPQGQKKKPQKSRGGGNIAGFFLYLLGSRLGIRLLFAGLALGGVGLFALYETYLAPDNTIETDLLSLKVPANWDEISLKDVAFCQNSAVNCLLAIDGDNITAVMEWETPLSNNFDEEYTSWQNYFQTSGRYEYVYDQRLQLGDHLTAIYEMRDFDITGTYYVRIAHILHGERLYNFEAWSSDENAIKENRDALNKIVESVQFK